MNIHENKEKFVMGETNLSVKHKSYIHLFSMRNIIFHFENLPNDKLKEGVLKLLNEYVTDVQENGFTYSAAGGYELIDKYTNKISEIYSSYLGFKTFLKFRFVLIFGILGDGILYFFVHKKLGFYFPIIFVILLTYFIYKIFF